MSRPSEARPPLPVAPVAIELLGFLSVPSYRRLSAIGWGTSALTSTKRSQELVMSSKTVQWMVWSFVMAFFSWLTLTARWTDLALALTLTAVFWYGIVPEARSRRQ